MLVTIQPGFAEGTIAVPASKSLSHRALICAGLAQGTSRLYHLCPSRDIQATIECLQALGAQITQEDGCVSVTGTQPAALHHPVILDAYESGSTLRFFIPIAAAGSEPVTFLGQPTLLSRPMGIYADLFARQGLPFEQSGEKITFCGPLQAGLFTLPGDISSQFISGLLFASPLLQGAEIAVLPPYQSRSYVDLSLQMMERFHIQVQQPTPDAYLVEPGQTYQPADVTIEGDYSQMAFFGVLGAIRQSIRCAGMARETRQGDAVILSILKNAGAEVSWNGDTVCVAHKALIPQTISLADCPDLGPILCVLAAYTPGTTRLVDAARLRYKESDRIAAMEAELKKWGVDIESDEDSITITGRSGYEQKETVVIDAHNDHRIVMAMTIFGLCAQSPSCIQDAQAVNKSYPGFFEDIARIAQGVHVQ